MGMEKITIFLIPIGPCIGQSLASHCARSGSIPCQSMLELWQTNWHWLRLSSENFGVPLSVSLRQWPVTIRFSANNVIQTQQLSVPLRQWSVTTRFSANNVIQTQQLSVPLRQWSVTIRFSANNVIQTQQLSVSLRQWSVTIRFSANNVIQTQQLSALWLQNTQSNSNIQNLITSCRVFTFKRPAFTYLNTLKKHP